MEPITRAAKITIFSYFFSILFLLLLSPPFLGSKDLLLASSKLFYLFFFISLLGFTFIFKIKNSTHSELNSFDKINLGWFSEVKPIGLITLFSLSYGVIILFFKIYLTYYIEEKSIFIFHANHYNYVFNSILLRFEGLIPLSEYKTHYGYYSIFLNPIFKIFGLSFFKFSVVMWGLQLTAFTLLLLVISKILISRTFTVIGFGAALLFFNTITLLTYNLESYHQFFPIRIFFPILALYLVSIDIKYKLRSILLGFLSGVAILWNFESGLLTFLCVSISELFPMPPYKKRSLFTSIINLGGVALGVICALLVVLIRFHLSFSDISALWSFLFQYSHKGFGMSYLSFSSPTVILWLFPCFIFLSYSILTSQIDNFNRKKPSALAMVVFFGFFFYLQGKGDLHALLYTIWAPILGLLFISEPIYFSLKEKFVFLSSIKRVFSFNRKWIIVSSILVLLSGGFIFIRIVLKKHATHMEQTRLPIINFIGQNCLLDKPAAYLLHGEIFFTMKLPHVRALRLSSYDEHVPPGNIDLFIEKIKNLKDSNLIVEESLFHSPYFDGQSFKNFVDKNFILYARTPLGYSCYLSPKTGQDIIP